MASTDDHDATTKQGPANPQDSRDLDAPTPPGGPMRSDSPAGTVAPGGPGTPTQPGEPHEADQPERPVVEPSGTPDGPQQIPTPSTPQGEPSDDSGSEEETA